MGGDPGAVGSGYYTTFMARTVLSTKFRIVIPKDIREETHLRKGQTFQVISKGGTRGRPVSARSGTGSEIVRLAVAAGEEKDFRPGMVAVVQTFGDQLNLHPHVHALGLLAHVPDPRRHLVHYYGAYSNVVRGKLKARSQAQQTEPLVPGPGEDAPPPRDSASPSLAALRRGWAQLIRRVYEIDPLVCPRCRGVMRVVAFITEGRVIRRILEHLGASARRATQDRAPPPATAVVPVSP